MPPPVPPPRWSSERLDADVAAAIDAFRQERIGEPLETYLDLFEECRDRVEELFEQSIDLTRLHQHAAEIMARPELVEVLRYLGGPFISEDDLKTVAEISTLAPSRLRADQDAAARVIDTALLALDRERFPWMALPQREPAPDERYAAVIATSTLMANERTKTFRRNAARRLQEEAVAEALDSEGFREITPPKIISVLEDAPGPGEYCRERSLGEDRADLIIGLWDRRRMPLECKSSNSAVNSVKRVNRESAGKAQRWLRDFGNNQVVPAAVLSGVFKRANLETAQSQGLTLFWAHSLGELVDWVAGTRR